MRRAGLVLAASLVLACQGASTPDAGAHDAAELDAGAHDAATEADAGAELRVDAGPDRYALVGDEVVLDGSGTTGAVRYQWAPGGGLPFGPEGESPTHRARYDAPGRYSAVLSAWDASGRRRADTVIISVTHPSTHVPRQSSSIAVVGDHLLAVVSPDSDEVALARWSDEGAISVDARVSVCDEPRTLAAWGGDRVLVSCASGAAVAVIELESRAVSTVVLPRGSRPFGVVAQSDSTAWVALQARGELVELEREGASARVVRALPAIADARGVAITPDARVAVTRWRSPDERGEIAVIDPTGARPPETWTLMRDPQPGSDTEVGGVPSYLEQVLFAPDGRLAVIPSTQCATSEGLFVTGGERALTFQTTLRAVISVIDPARGEESFTRRRQLDNRGFANGAAFSSRGDWLFVLGRGTRTVDRIDMLASEVSGGLSDVGYAPQGLALSPDDRFLFVDAYLSREIVAYDVRSFAELPTPVGRASIPTAEPLSAELLVGARLFNDSADRRLAQDGYIACAHCHLDGEDDHRVWDFTDRGEGLRNTATLRGVASTGAIHWSANFDELQDFEHDIRGPFGGRGLMADADFHTGTRDTTLGDRKAGVSAELDALAAYVTSIGLVESPYRDTDGSLSDAATRGRALFESTETGCTECHSGARLTDSAFTSPGVPVLHDVGTLGAPRLEVDAAARGKGRTSSATVANRLT